MAVYVVIEATVRGPEARDTYARQSMPLLEPFGGSVLTVGPWRILDGEAAFDNGMLIEFPTTQAATDWYNSEGYQALIPTRDRAMDVRFRLLG